MVPSSLCLTNRLLILIQAEHTYKFDVKMTCGGCSGAVTRVLEKAKTSGGVSEFNVDLATQEVLVKGTMPYDDVHSIISKTGKEVSIGTISSEPFSYRSVFRFALE
ncbi:hypothetical protein H4582DRAFT_1814179 [Lactarius indigo]|nr:hypothetical protein H4582DRAFT_1828409 [Lactarius indigo]KAI9438595.1 hypothetical protein H4582DRAFT_1814179 [Lactarius indigo]